MATSNPSKESLLLNADRVEPDQYRGDHELLSAHGLSAIAAVVFAGNSKIGNYVSRIKHFDGLRKGPNMELAPLADLHPSSVKPDFAPPSANSLAASLTLEPGKFTLSESDRGIPVDHRSLLGEEEKPPKPAPAPAKPTKIKLKLPVKKS